MTTHYTDEINVQIVISLLKQHGIRKVIASPGTTNMTFLASIQQDSWFEIYSSVDERSAAYMACGLSAESGEPVVINCTGATASRNYLPGLTEAYYRKLPIIAITGSRESSKIGHLNDQVTNRSTPPIDTVKYSTTIPIAKDNEDIWDCEMKVNTAFLECRRRGGGPVHINLESRYSKNFTVKQLPEFRKINRYAFTDVLPGLPVGKKIAIYIGAHRNMTKEQTEAIDKFCASNNAVAFCSHTSNYYGKYAINPTILASQELLDKTKYEADLVIHIGEVSGNTATLKVRGDVWRVSSDGNICDTYRRLKCVFDMPIEYFFNYYSSNENTDDSYFELCKQGVSKLKNSLPEIPFSNIWIASQIAHRIPCHSTVHFGILNSLRSWNLFNLPDSVTSMSNVGGYGIDGGLSSLVGASLFDSNKLYYMIIGDLAFFYDMNVAGNRHVGNNVRILLVNNGKGSEFRLYKHPVARFGDDADAFMAAAGHYGNKSDELIKNYAENLGYEYISARTKQEFDSVSDRFITPTITDKPMLFEVFTENYDESSALKEYDNINSSMSGNFKKTVKDIVNTLIGSNAIDAIVKNIKK